MSELLNDASLIAKARDWLHTPRSGSQKDWKEVRDMLSLLCDSLERAETRNQDAALCEGATLGHMMATEDHQTKNTDLERQLVEARRVREAAVLLVKVDKEYGLVQEAEEREAFAALRAALNPEAQPEAS